MITIGDISDFLSEKKVGHTFTNSDEIFIAEHRAVITVGALRNPKPRNFYSNRSKELLSRRVLYYVIWEDLPIDLAKSIISSKLGFSERVYARNLTLTTIDRSTAVSFFDENHIDGANKSASTTYALVKGNTIYCAMSLLNRRIQSRKTSAWEIGRFATKKGYTVVGGYSAMLKQAIKDLKALGVTDLYSYCDRDISPDPTSTFYAKYGFKFLAEAGSIYWYWASEPFMYLGKLRKNRVSRQTVQKQKLLQHFNEVHIELPNPCTEATLCKALGLVPCYNSGNFKYVLHLQDATEVQDFTADSENYSKSLDTIDEPSRTVYQIVNDGKVIDSTTDPVVLGQKLASLTASNPTNTYTIKTL